MNEVRYQKGIQTGGKFREKEKVPQENNEAM